MGAKYASILIFLILLVCFQAVRPGYFEARASPGYPVHNLNSGLNYTTITEAVEASETLSGDTIFVESGVYDESVSVGKQLHLVGENRDTTIIDGNLANEVLWLFQNVSVTNFTIRHGLYGIRMQVGSTILPQYGGNKVISNRIEGALYCGIILEKASNNTIIDNIITDNLLSGIHLSGSTNNTMTNNVVFDNGHGIDLYGNCRGNVLRNNTIFDNAYNFGLIWYGDTFNWFLGEKGRPNTVNDIDASNTVNGKPIYCWTNRSNEQIPSDAGFVWLTDCDNITVRNLNLSYNIEGVMLAGTTNTLIYNNSITRNAYGVHLSLFSYNNTFVNNTLRDNDNGVYLGEFASNTIMRNNTISGGQYNFGVPLWNPGYIGWWYPSLNTTAGLDDIDLSNTVNGKSIVWWIDQHNIRVPSNAGYVVLINCTDITVEGLSLSNNMQNILLMNSNNTLISNNSISNSVNGIWVKDLYFQSSNGWYFQPSVNNTIMDCTFLENGVGCKVEEGDCKFLNNTLYRNPTGIGLKHTNNSTIAGNTVIESKLDVTYKPLEVRIFFHPSQHWELDNDLLFDNVGGILFDGKSNMIYDNMVENSSWGISAAYWTYSAKGNVICHNNLINNDHQAGEPNPNSNYWDLGYPSGGNYWSDYSGTDNFSGLYQNETGSDGIGDTAFFTGWTGVLDHYPLFDPYMDNIDLSISDLWVSSAVLSDNRQIMNISISVTNLSLEAETFNVTLRANSTTLSTFPNMSLAVGKSINVTYEWNVTDLEYGRYLINASITPAPNETRISDNARTVLTVHTIPGDLNEDGTVNKDDAGIFVDQFDLAQNEPNLVSSADLNGDASVNILDAIILSNNFGRTW